MTLKVKIPIGYSWVKPYLRPIVNGKENKIGRIGLFINTIYVDGIQLIEYPIVRDNTKIIGAILCQMQNEEKQQRKNKYFESPKITKKQ